MKEYTVTTTVLAETSVKLTVVVDDDYDPDDPNSYNITDIRREPIQWNITEEDFDDEQWPEIDRLVAAAVAEDRGND